MVIDKIKTAYGTARDFGFKWTAQRLFYELQLRTGHHKRNLPKRAWAADELSHWLKPTCKSETILKDWLHSNRPFLFHPEDQSELGAAMRQLYALQPELLKDLEQVDIHKHRFFVTLRYDSTFPDIWFTNPFLNPPAKCDPNLHWSDYPMHHQDYEDLKFIWEPGRFSMVYDLVRSYSLTNDPSLPEQFWVMVESWIDHNPPNTGPHWKCGQETALRLMAWYFGLAAFKNCAATTPERFNKFLAAVAVQAHRISKDLKYSILQHSNHAVTEGLGLYVTGLLFPQLHLAEKWVKKGKEILEERVLFLIREDGTYYQKSHNYLRFILHCYTFVLAVAKVYQDDFSNTLKTRLNLALDYLKSVVDEKSGRVPNFGSNDGALVLPLNSMDFSDFRSVVSAMHFCLHGERYYANGPWSEDLLWLFGSKAIDEQKTPLAQQKKRSSIKYEDHGIYVLQNPLSWSFMHAESFQDRPAQADALHLDIWWKGQNICVDPGTYLYYGHAPWLAAFRHTKVHNTVTVDNRDQMDRAYRFTWANWHQCQLNYWDGESQAMEIEHNGYQRLSDPVIHRRAVICIDREYWIVIDDLIGKEEHDIRLHWLFNDFSFQQEEEKIHFKTPEGPYTIGFLNFQKETNELKITEGNPSTGIMGLRSNYYGRLERGVSLELTQKTTLPARYISCLGPQGWQISIDALEKSIVLKTTGRSHAITLKQIGNKKIIDAVNSSDGIQRVFSQELPNRR